MNDHEASHSICIEKINKSTHVLTVVISREVDRGEIHVIFHFHFLNYYLCGMSIFQNDMIVDMRFQNQGRGK